MAGFDDLGLKDDLVDNARAVGFDAPSALQRAVIPVLRRGGNAIIHASSGSGATVAYSLALLDRFAAATETRALVIVATADRAERVASTIARLGRGTGVRVAALTNAWSSPADAVIVVASAEKLRNAIEESQLKLDQIESVVVDGAAASIKLAGAPAFDAIFATLPSEGQRVFVSSELGDAVRKIAESHARKAIHFPARPAVEERGEKPTPTGKLRYVIAPAAKKADHVARFARAHGGAVTLIARSISTAREAEHELRARGFDANATSFDQFERAEAVGLVIAYDAPFSADQLTERLREGDIVVCERDELAHLKNLAAEANLRIEAATMPAYEVDSLNAFRNEIRKAAREEDIEAQLLVLEPLFSELSVEEVAAAATALLRTKRPMKAETAGSKAGMKTWSRLFLSVGERDGVRAGDIVGAITGESGIKGDEVGRVDLRDTFSVVEVDSTVADKVISALNGTTMKNRALRVDYDRKTAGGGSRGGRPQGGRPEGGRPERGRPEAGRSPGGRTGPRVMKSKKPR